MSGTSPEFVVLTFSPDPSIAFFLKGVLDCAGFSVTAVAHRHEDMLAAAARLRPDVIVYDVRRPIAEECGALRRLRRRWQCRNIPLLITTSDPRALYDAAGVGSAIELGGGPDDVRRVREAVDRAVNAGSVHPAA